MSLKENIFPAARQFLSGLLTQLPVMLFGLPLVALGLPFVRQYPETTKPFTQYPGEWTLVRLPSWLAPWDNTVDGLLGDKRGWWDNETGNARSYWSMWRWAAIRNPANYFKRFIMTCDVRGAKIDKVAGQDYVRDDLNSTGVQLLRAQNAKGTYYHFYLVKRWGKSNRALVLELGYKFRLGDESLDYSGDSDYKAFKGFTFEVNPYKDIS